LKTTALYPIANNGSASTPFYTALALWVGAVLFASVSTTSVFLEKKDKGLYSERDQFAGRMLTYLSVSFMQALIVTLGNIFLLGVDVHEAVLSVVFALLIALAFSMLVYVLVALFGTVGKGLAVIILVLSISGGGGNYPIQVSSHFFQVINPLLPFTYAVNLLRESAGGVYWPNAWRDITVLVSIFVVSGLLGTAFYPKVSKLTEKLTKVANETHLFH
jgi:putative membrane protein